MRDAAYNYQSGPIATAVQKALTPVAMLVTLPLGTVMNAAAAALSCIRGPTKAVERRTLPQASLLRRVLSRTKILTVIELEEVRLDERKCRQTFDAFRAKNGFTPGEATLTIERRTEILDKTVVYDALFERSHRRLVEYTIVLTPSQTFLCGLFDFGFFDGTSCFNFGKGLLESYFEGHPVENRPRQASSSLDLTLDEEISMTVTRAHVLERAVIESGRFATRWARWITSREWLDLLIPARVSLATATLSTAETRAMLTSIAGRRKPFPHLMHTVGDVLRERHPRKPIGLLTQISLQERYYTPKRPRNQVGYWLIGKADWIDIDRLADADWCDQFYDALKDEIATFSGGVRDAFVQQATLGLGGASHICNPRKIVWFNNYGKRSLHPKAGPATYHWGPNFNLHTYVLLNTVSVDGRLCITLSSTVLAQEQLEECLREFRARLVGSAL